MTAARLPHPVRVALRCLPHGPAAVLLALVHDGVEDGWLPRWCLRWRALDAITRRPGEPYLRSYIPRVRTHPLARVVKLADLADNMGRPHPRGRLLSRYDKATMLLLGIPR